MYFLILEVSSKLLIKKPANSFDKGYLLAFCCDCDFLLLLLILFQHF